VMMFIGPDVPVPDLQWPGGDKPRAESPTPRPHRPDVPVAGPPRLSSRPRTQPSPGGVPQQLSPSPSPTRPPIRRPKPPPRGTLIVAPVSVDLGARSTVADIDLTAKDGRVAWTASNSDPKIVLSNVSGEIAAGEHATVQVILNRQLITPAGQSVVTVTDGSGRSTAVHVSWDLSLL
jgi:hypothetical protein